MNDLTIGRLTATTSPWPQGEVSRVPEMLQRLADHRLEAALRVEPLPEGEWCVRRLDVEVELDPERPTSALETDWAEQIVIAIRRSLTTGSEDVIRYDRHESALDDLLVGLVTRHPERSWAWRQVGLLEPGDPRPEDAPLSLFLRVLARQGHGAAGAVLRLVRRVGAPSVHRLLGSDGWTQVAVIATGASGSPAVDTGSAEPRREAPEPGAEAVAGRLVAGSALARAFGSAGLRADEATRAAWARLVLAEVAPTRLRAADADLLARAVADLLPSDAPSGLAGRPTRPTRHATPPRGRRHEGPDSDRETSADPGADVRPDTAPATEGIAGPTAGADPASGPQAGPETGPDLGEGSATSADEHAVLGARTAWGGLVFLLNTAAPAGLPDLVLEDAVLGRRPLSWTLQRVATRLVPAPLDDPAVLVVAGLDPELPEAGEPAPTVAESVALDILARTWADATCVIVDAAAGREDAPGDSSVDRVRGLAHREATVYREPGWVEVELSLESVDLDVRRAGLDLDPGWVWWLGQVVRFSYG